MSFSEAGKQVPILGLWQLQMPRVILRPRLLLALEARTDYELLRTLQDDGWTWLRWKKKKGVYELPIAYKPGDPKIWRTGGGLLRHYMIALLRAEELCGDGPNLLDMIPHGHTDSDYKKVLKGEKLLCKDTGALEPDIAPEDEAAAMAPDADADADAAADDDADAAYSSSCPTLPETSEDLGSDAEAAGELGAPPAAGELGAPPAAGELGAPPAPAPIDEDEETAKILEAGEWGMDLAKFKFKVKADNSIQCTCPYHKKHGDTGCKKSISLPKGWAPKAARTQVMKYLLWWASAMETDPGKYDRQWKHIKLFGNDILNAPALSEILPNMPTMIPPDPVLNDVELEDMAEKGKRQRKGKVRRAKLPGQPPSSSSSWIGDSSDGASDEESCKIIAARQKHKR